MFFDLADLDRLEANGHLEGTIVHEMAHVIGFGTLWEHLGLLQNPARPGLSANTHFTGAAAKAAFDEIRAGNYTDSEFVPVQHQGGEGVWNGHWRELVFRSELMTPFPDRGPNPLSVVSIALQTSQASPLHPGFPLAAARLMSGTYSSSPAPSGDRSVDGSTRPSQSNRAVRFA